jgi:hypothetical protein
MEPGSGLGAGCLVTGDGYADALAAAAGLGAELGR